MYDGTLGCSGSNWALRAKDDFNQGSKIRAATIFTLN